MHLNTLLDIMMVMLLDHYVLWLPQMNGYTENVMKI